MTVYALAVAAAFAFFYPTYAAVPLSPVAFDLRMWWESWCARSNSLQTSE